MSQDKPVVKCSISNCNFWGENNFCQADSIMIDIDQHATRRLHEEFAGETFTSDDHEHARTSSATCCQTFRPK